MTIAIVEMNVGIIAASLIVMRPCLKAIHNAVLKRCRLQRVSRAGDSPYSTLSRVPGIFQDKGVMRSVDFELESQPVSTREVMPKDLLG